MYIRSFMAALRRNKSESFVKTTTGALSFNSIAVVQFGLPQKAFLTNQ